MLLFRDVLCPVLYHQSGADLLNIDLNAFSAVGRPGCSGGNMSDGAPLVFLVGQSEQPFGNIDLFNRSVNTALALLRTSSRAFSLKFAVEIKLLIIFLLCMTAG